MAAGFVKDIDVRDGSVLIGFPLRSRRTDKLATMEEGIRQAVSSLPGGGAGRDSPPTGSLS